jgi:hypothetical protein
MIVRGNVLTSSRGQVGDLQRSESDLWMSQTSRDVAKISDLASWVRISHSPKFVSNQPKKYDRRTIDLGDHKPFFFFFPFPLKSNHHDLTLSETK